MTRILAIFLILFASMNLGAQQLPLYNLHWVNPFLYNPANAADRGAGYVWLNHRRQWSSMEDAPISTALTVEVPLSNDRIGVGMSLYADQAHILRRVAGSATFAYHVPFSTIIYHGLSLGVSAGFAHQRINASDILIAQPDDPALYGATFNGAAFEASAGASYHYKGFRVGVALPQLFTSKMTYTQDGAGENAFSLVKHIFGQVSQSIAITEQISVRPVAAIRYIKNLPIQGEFWATGQWNNMVDLGLGYRNGAGSGLMASLGFKIGPARIYYSFETPISGNERSNLGFSHEITAGFKFADKKLDKQVERLNKDFAEMDERYLRESAARDSILAVKTDSAEDRNNKRFNKLEGRVDELEKAPKPQPRVDENGKVISGGSDTVVTKINLDYKKLGTVFFGKGSSTLTEATKSNLKNVADLIKKNKQVLTVYLQGNASKEGGANENYLLSIRRTKEVKDYLIGQGVPADRVLMMPYGAENPATPNQDSEDERSKNRRVDIYLLAD